jgi:hypothetical protein
MQQQLLKSGELSMTDYLTGRQNLIDGTEQAFTLMDEYQAVYEKKMQRAKETNPDMSSQQLEVWLMENVEGFSNFNRSQLIPDPRTGKVSVGLKVKDPETGLMTLSKDPNDRRSIGALRGQIMGEFDMYNIEAKTKEWVDSNGEWSQTLRQFGSRTGSGLITTILNPMEKLITTDGKGNRVVDTEKLRLLGVPEDELEGVNLYLKAEDGYITSQSANPHNVSSVLTENAKAAPNGKLYTFTMNKDDAKKNPEKILLDPTTYEPIFDKEINPNGPEQEEVFRTYMRNAIRNKHNVTQKVQTVNDYQRETKPTNFEYERGDAQKQKKKLATVWNKLYYAPSANDKNDLLQSILGDDMMKTAGVTDISFSPDGRELQVTYLDSRKNRVIPISENPSPSEWAGIGSEIHGISDAKEGVRLGGGFPDDVEYINQFEGVRASREGKTPDVDYQKLAYNDLETKADNNANLFIDGDDEYVIPDLQAIFGSYGFQFENESNFNNNVKVTLNGNKDDYHIFNVNNNETDATKVMDGLLSWMSARVSKESAERVYKTQKKGRTQSPTVPSPTDIINPGGVGSNW